MTSKIKVNILADGGDNAIITSDGAGSFTASSGLASSVQSVGGIQNTPSAYYQLTSNQNVTNATWTNMSSWTAILSSANFSSGTFTIPTNGNYQIMLSVRTGSSTSYNYYNSGARIVVNGSTYYYGFGLEANASSPYPNYCSAIVNVVLNLSSGNTITFDGYSQIASGTPIFLASTTQFSIVKLIGA